MKYSNNIKKIIAVILGYFNLITHNLVSFILTPVMILTWGDGNYGLYKIILSLMIYFLLVDSGIKNSVIRFISEFRSLGDINKARIYVGTIIIFYMVATLFLVFLVFIFSNSIPALYSHSLTVTEQSILKESLPWLLVFTVGTLYFNCFSAIMRGFNHQISVQLINIIRTIARFSIIFYLLKKQNSVVQVVEVDALISIVFSVFVVLYVFLILKVPPNFLGITKPFLKKILSFSGIMMVYTIAHSLLWSIGNFIVSVKTSSVAAAVYTTSITLTNMFQSLSGTISQVLAPDIMLKSFSITDNNYLNNLMIRVGLLKMYAILLIFIGFIFFGNDFILLWVGKNYTDVYSISIVILIPLFLGLIQDVPINVMLTRNKHKTMMFMTIVALIINVCLSVYLIDIFGIIGAAIGTAVAYASVYVFFAYFYFSKKLNFNMKRFYIDVLFKNVFFVIFASIIAFAITLIPLEGWGGFALKLAIFISMYGLMMTPKIALFKKGNKK